MGHSVLTRLIPAQTPRARFPRGVAALLRSCTLAAKLRDHLPEDVMLPRSAQQLLDAVIQRAWPMVKSRHATMTDRQDNSLGHKSGPLSFERELHERIVAIAT